MLYHIRLFKLPTVTLAKRPSLTAVIGITNDLGDSFFYGSVDLVIECAGITKTVGWKSGARSCAVQFDLPASRREVQLSVRADESSVVDVLEENPHFLPVKTVVFSTSGPCPRLAVRYGLVPSKTFEIREECGSHSLARHVWDAGLATCQWLYEPGSESILGSPKTILELGTGCGLVGLALGLIYPTASIRLTDLDDARDICITNIESSTQTNVEFGLLDWDEPNPPQDKWDLVVVTDCTYNPSSYDSLLNALKSVTTAGTRILLAHKYRDPDHEEEFFERLPYKRELDTIVQYYDQPVRLLVMS